MQATTSAYWKAATTGAFALLAVGCGTVQPPYKPAQVGMLPDSSPVAGLVMSLQPDRTTAHIGDAINFHIKIKNMGNATVWLPKDPDIFLMWTYPDGKCDNFVRDDYSPTAPLALAPLAPGEERLFKSCVTTYYFDRRGVTEFRARVSVPTTYAGNNSLAWTGDMASNGYGVMFAN